MIIRKRKMLTKSRYFRYDAESGEYEIRAPSSVSKWPRAFRERLITKFEYPGEGLTLSAFRAYRSFMEAGEWAMHTDLVKFVILYLTHDSGAKIPINVVVAHSQDRSLILDSGNPAMRTLATYSFLTGEEIEGLPSLKYMSRTIVEQVVELRHKLARNTALKGRTS